jgi:hypothetical protein
MRKTVLESYARHREQKTECLSVSACYKRMLEGRRLSNNFEGQLALASNFAPKESAISCALSAE